MNTRKYLGAVGILGAFVLLVNPALARNPAVPLSPAAVSSGLVVLTGQTPSIVRLGQAQVLQAHPASAPLSVGFSLPLRNVAELKSFIETQASHGRYLTPAQFKDRYAPTPDQVRAVRDWATSQHLQVSYASPDGLLITARGTTEAVSAALHVHVNDYRSASGTTFYANDADASLPADLGVTAVTGLDTIPKFQTALHPASTRMTVEPASVRSGGFLPIDFRNAYGLTGNSVSGTGQVIGLVLWGAALNPAQHDLSNFASAAQTAAGIGDVDDPAMSASVVTTPTNAGADQVEWVYTNGTSTLLQDQNEVALDVEYAHAMAPGSHLVYYLAHDSGDDTGLAAAIVQAENNPAISVISNSWYFNSPLASTDSFVQATEPAFMAATAQGKTFLIASGDSGSNSGGNSMPAYPSDDPYTVGVGGSTLNMTQSASPPFVYSYNSEQAWSGAGAGCTTSFPRPSWQNLSNTNHANGSFFCSGRAVPDLSANAGAFTLVYYQGTSGAFQGTSIATPLIAGMMASANNYALAHSMAPLGWLAPALYSLGNSNQYTNAFNDVTTGSVTGGLVFPATTGWDQATGWGTPNWLTWTQGLLSQPPPPPVSPTLTATITATPTVTATPTISRTPTVTKTPPASPTATSTATATGTATATTIPATSTSTPTASVTNTPTASATATATFAGATSTQTPTAPAATATSTPTLPAATATPTNTAAPPTATNTFTPLPTATATPTTGSGGLINGDFELGSFTGWTAKAANSPPVAPQITIDAPHGGNYAALVGSTRTSAPLGDSCLYQDFTTSGGTFSAWYKPLNPYGDTISYEWQEGYLRPSGSSGCYEAGTRLFKVESNAGTWTQVSKAVPAGSYQAYFNMHEDGYLDASYMYVDDVSVTGGSLPATPTLTAPPTASPTSTSLLPTATFTATATRTATPSGPTATASLTPTLTRTLTATPTATGNSGQPSATATVTRTATPSLTPTASPTPAPSGTNLIANGSFESGLLGWTSKGVGQGGQPTISTSVIHTGSQAARLGMDHLTTGNAPYGDNCLYQDVNVPGSHTFSFWYNPYNVTGSTISYEWQEAYWRPVGASGCYEAGTKLLKIESNGQIWQQYNGSVPGAGQMYFNVHEDGYADPTALFIDDVSVR